VIITAIWDYQFILFPIGNVPTLTEDGMEFVGQNNFVFVQAVELLENSAFIKNDPTLKSWNSFNDACYFLFYDGMYKVEIELNTGTEAEKAEEISVRTNIYKDEGSVTEALRICRMLCDSLSLNCWSMKLRKIVDLNDIHDVEFTINQFNELRNKD
jgi:hypothetical protein